MQYDNSMSKKVKKKINLDPFTDANDIQATGPLQTAKDSKKQTKSHKKERLHQKELVRQITDEFVKISKHDLLDESLDRNPHQKVNEVIYTIKPVKSKDDI